MQYPTGFPEHLQRPVDKAIADAEFDFVKAKQGLSAPGSREILTKIGREFIAKVCFAFGRQLCEAVKAGLVTGETARSQMESFLHTVIVKAYFDKCPDRSGDSSAFASFEDRTKRQLKDSSEWGEYQKAMADALRPNQTAQEGPKEQAPQRAAREAFVLPILREKGMTRSKWATAAGVDPAVVYDYLRGDSNPRPDSRKVLAEAIGLKESDLPE